MKSEVAGAGLGINRRVCLCRSRRHLRDKIRVYSVTVSVKIETQALEGLVGDEAVRNTDVALSHGIKSRTLQRDIHRQSSCDRIILSGEFLQVGEGKLRCGEIDIDGTRRFVRPMCEPGANVESQMPVGGSLQLAILKGKRR